MILSVDPGAKHCGLALWDKSKLVHAWLEPVADGWFASAHAKIGSYAMTLNAIVVERMKIYPAMRMRGDPNDLVTVTIVGAELVGFLLAYFPKMRVTYYYGKTWKGNLPKDAHGPHIMAELSEKEVGAIELPRAKALAHNIIDSIGLGLFHVGRSERGKRAGRKA